VQATDGNLYGTTIQGGAHDDGTVFKITLGGTLTTIYSFCVQGCADGALPEAGLVQATDGNFYGTTEAGGTNGYGHGTVFKITPQGTLTTLYSFCAQNGCTDGAAPFARLAQGADGNFYGTTSNGGANGYGTVFKITPSGTLTTYSLNYMDGVTPIAGLVQGTDGNFYGTTQNGGANYYGTIFKMTPAGTLTALYSFCSQTSCTDGVSPWAGVVQATDGNFYGTTIGGGTTLAGTVFKITPKGKLTTLYSFDPSEAVAPYAGLVQAADGYFYGTTAYGGPSHNCNGGCGTVFRLDSGFFAALSVTKIGAGTVSTSDGHIYCGAVCSYPYPNATPVTLSALPAPGYTFTGWTGCDNMNGSYCSVTMTSAKNVTATFSTANVTLTSLTFKPSYVRGGQLSAGTLTLSAAAPPGGVTVALSSDHAGVAHPPSFVFVPGGKSSVWFAVQTFPVKSNTTVTITATAGSSHVSGTLTVGTTSLPPSLK
jgi:uncharacterized repeat protein (TIGR02543 family)